MLLERNQQTSPHATPRLCGCTQQSVERCLVRDRDVYRISMQPCGRVCPSFRDPVRRSRNFVNWCVLFRARRWLARVLLFVGFPRKTADARRRFLRRRVFAAQSFRASLDYKPYFLDFLRRVFSDTRYSRVTHAFRGTLTLVSFGRALHSLPRDDAPSCTCKDI